MRLLTALEIASNQPNGDILITSEQDKKTLKWASFMYLMRDGQIHKLILSYEINQNFKGFDSKEDAIIKMENLVQYAIEYCRKQGYKI